METAKANSGSIQLSLNTLITKAVLSVEYCVWEIERSSGETNQNCSSRQEWIVGFTYFDIGELLKLTGKLPGNCHLEATFPLWFPGEALIMKTRRGSLFSIRPSPDGIPQLDKLRKVRERKKCYSFWTNHAMLKFSFIQLKWCLP